MAIYCPNCGMELPEGVSFCDACGTPVRGLSGSAAPAANSVGIGSVACPVCATPALPGEAFCDNCGASLIAPGEVAAAPSAPAPSGPSTVITPGYQPSSSPPPYQAPAGTPSSPDPQSAIRNPQLVVTQPPPPATLTLPARQEMIVGRSDPQSNSYPDVDLGPYGGLDLGVSRRHFRLTRTGEQFYIEDLGAMNGTVVNNQKLPPYTLQPLRSGDRISLGKMEMRFELG
jgi:hypothetical protein